ncbi:uncharacterized protein [Nicotiana tomentosiformis]|uniref:uncharacterized protein n=1 Tax=Nicotiana tomentosiformis TaxID=4098 RepID=UPI00388C3B3F
MALYEALYERWCRSPVGWFEMGEGRLLGTDLVQDDLEKVKVIREWLRTPQSRQKRYADKKVRDVVGEKVLLKISPMKGVLRFGKKGKLSPRYIGPFEILKKIGKVANELALPPSLSGVYPVFQIRKLRSKNIASVKVQWRGQPVGEATWEIEQEMRSKYPRLFKTPVLTDMERIRKFIDGLTFHLRLLLTRERVSGATFDEVVDIARQIEKVRS